MGGCVPSQLRSLVSPWDNEKPNSSRMTLKEPKREPIMSPHKFEDIMKEADDPSLDVSNDLIYSEVFLSNKTKKYWVERETMNNCFMLFARSLTFAWGEDPKHWVWSSIEKSSDVEMAVLLGVYWLEIYGKLKTSYLTPNVTYEVVFVVMMDEASSDVPVTLKLKLPDRSFLEQQKVSLKEQPRLQWIELKIGEFKVKSDQEGEMEISLFEYGNQQKKGLMVKGAIIRPKKLL